MEQTKEIEAILEKFAVSEEDVNIIGIDMSLITNYDKNEIMVVDDFFGFMTILFDSENLKPLKNAEYVFFRNCVTDKEMLEETIKEYSWFENKPFLVSRNYIATAAAFMSIGICFFEVSFPSILATNIM